MRPGRRIRKIYDRTYGRLGPLGRWRASLAGLAVIGLGAGLAWGSWAHLCDACPSIAQIYAFEPKEATRLYTADGAILAELAVERRTPIDIQNLPRHVYDAFIAVEDKRFWKHGGIDPRGTFRAFVGYVLPGYSGGGGSTITQQLAGNMFPGSVDRREISVRRKLREMRVSVALEGAYEKQEILEAYLNQINFDGIFGVQAAALHYFAKEASQLNLPEAATLAALPVSPATYNPVRHPERAVRRRNLILELMADQDMIGRAEAEAAKSYPLELSVGADRGQLAPYFVEWVRQILYSRYGTDVYEKGYRVYTTLDPGLQLVADSALHAQLAWVEKQPAFDAPTYEETRDWPADSLARVAGGGGQMPYVQGGFIALDPATGDVRALVGGRDFRDSEFNRAIQAIRQPGSVFKPFVYTAAIAAGIPASEIVYDSPILIENRGSEPYSPKNFGDDFKGPMTLRAALRNSINVVAVKVGQLVGEESMAQIANSMGIESEIPRVPSAAIGAASIRPIEIATAYTTFANMGVRVTPRAILRIESNDGRVLWESRVSREQVLEPRVSWVMLSMLRDAVDRGTGRWAVRTQAGIPFEIPVAGKTGTTNSATDAWFVAFTPDIVTTSWVGFDLPTRLYRNAQGGITAAPIGAAVLDWYYQNRPAPEPWPRPQGLVDRSVDQSTGLLATAWCPAELVYQEIYLPGTEPTETCDVHGPWGIRERPDSLRYDDGG